MKAKVKWRDLITGEEKETSVMDLEKCESLAEFYNRYPKVVKDCVIEKEGEE